MPSRRLRTAKEIYTAMLKAKKAIRKENKSSVSRPLSDTETQWRTGVPYGVPGHMYLGH
jgi:hypothetical protein